MTRLAGWKCGAALAGLLVAATVTPAAPVPPSKSPLAQIPEKAPFVLYVHGVQRTYDRLLVTLKASLPDLAPLIEKQFDSWLKDGIEGRKLAGLEKDGPMFLAFLEMPRDLEKPPKMALIAAVSDYAKFRDGLLDDAQKKALKKGANGVEETALPFGEDKLFFLNRPGWAIVSLDKESIETFTKDYQGLDTRLTKELSGKLLDSDLGLYLSMDAVNKEYALQIAAMKKELNDQVFPQLENTGALDKGMLKMYKALLDGAFQAAEDSKGILLTAEFRPAGLALHVQAEIRADTPASKALKQFQSSPFADLKRLPSGQAYYTAMAPSAELMEAIGPLLFSVQGDPKKEEDKGIRAALDKIVKAGPTEALSAVNIPMTGVQVLKFKKPAEGLAGQLDLLRTIQANSAFQQVVVKAAPEIKLKAQQYQGIEFHSVALSFDLEKTIDRAAGLQNSTEEQRKVILGYYQKMIGEQVHLWLGTDGKVVVQVVAPDWKSAREKLDAYFSSKGTLGDETAFKELRKEMPAEATFVGALDPVMYGLFLADTFRMGFEAAGGGMVLPPSFGKKPDKHVPAYFGLAVTLKPERGSVDVFFSAKGIQEGYKVFGKPFFDK